MRKIAVKELWAQEVFAVAAKVSPMVHRERFAFNYGVHMGIEVAKEKWIEKLFTMLKQCELKHDPVKFNLSAEIKLIDSMIQYHRDLGEEEISCE